jgi:uncharacterized Zn finger protein
MEQLVFLVKGSSSEPYELTFIKDGDSLTALCTCPAGQFGNLCKHRVSILDGQTKSISSDNANQVSTVTGWLAGTDVEAALLELRKAEKSSETTKDDLAALKRKLSRAMNS